MRSTLFIIILTFKNVSFQESQQTGRRLDTRLSEVGGPSCLSRTLPWALYTVTCRAHHFYNVPTSSTQVSSSLIVM